jgi:hypothetical protein
MLCILPIYHRRLELQKAVAGPESCVFSAGLPLPARADASARLGTKTFKCFRTDFRTDGFSGWLITQVIVFIGGTAGHRIRNLSACLCGENIFSFHSRAQNRARTDMDFSGHLWTHPVRDH